MDAAGDAYVTGYTNSPDFPRTGGPLQTSFPGIDVFVAKVNAEGSALAYATYLGASGGVIAGQGIAVDAAGNAYVTGVTEFPNLPPVGSPLQPRFGGGFSDAFVAKLGSAIVPPTLLSFTATPTLGTDPLVGVPVAFAVTVVDPSKVQSVQWDFNGDGTVDQTTTGLTTQFTYAAAGTLTAKVTVIDADGGTASAAVALTVQSPAQALATAEALVEQLPLNQGQQNSLSSKLEAAAKQLNQGSPADGCGTLGAEVNELNAHVKTGKLSAASATPLLGEVQALQRSLGCL